MFAGLRATSDHIITLWISKPSVVDNAATENAKLRKLLQACRVKLEELVNKTKTHAKRRLKDKAALRVRDVDGTLLAHADALDSSVQKGYACQP